MSRHAFHDPVHPHAKVVLVITDARELGKRGVEHPDCTYLAVVSPDLDAYYCSECRWNGRISGAWFLDKWRAR